MAYMAYMAHMAAMVFILPTRWVKEIKCQTATRSHDSPLYRLVGTWWTVCSVFSLTRSGSRYKSIFNHFAEFPPFHSGLVLPLRIPHRLLLHVLLLLLLLVQQKQRQKQKSCWYKQLFWANKKLFLLLPTESYI